MEKQLLPMEQLAELLEVQLDSGGTARLVVTGNSMYPLFRSRRDAVVLIPLKRSGKKGDIILYRRKNSGQFVLHRILRAEGSHYTCCGDNQNVLEPVDHAQVIAVVERFVRKGREYAIDHPGYRLYMLLWVDLFPVRKVYISLRRWLGRQRARFLKNWRKDK